MIEINRVAAKAKLDNCKQKITATFAQGSTDNMPAAIGGYFLAILNNRDALSFNDVVEAIDIWHDALNAIGEHSYGASFLLAVNAYNQCNGEGQFISKNEQYILNAVCVAVGHFAEPAYQSFVKVMKAVEMIKSKRYIGPVINALMTVAQHSNIDFMRETYLANLVHFERMLYSPHVHPLHRYEYVLELFEWSKDRLHCSDLRKRMEEILRETSCLPDGRGMILHGLEVEADELARKSKEWMISSKGRVTSKRVVDIKVAFAVRAGLPPKYANNYQRIEAAFASKDFSRVEDQLNQLFERLALQTDDKNSFALPDDISVYPYLSKSADKLSKLSPIHGFQLAERCIETTETEMYLNEHLLSTIYGFALPALVDAENFGAGYTGRIKELYKVMMKRSSEFEPSEEAGQIFEDASIGFENYLAAISPVSRYLEVSELKRWLDIRIQQGELLHDFVARLLDCSVSYGNELGIPFDCDQGANVRPLPVPHRN